MKRLIFHVPAKCQAPRFCLCAACKPFWIARGVWREGEALNKQAATAANESK